MSDKFNERDGMMTRIYDFGMFRPKHQRLSTEEGADTQALGQ
jgi:hypothetical protein